MLLNQPCSSKACVLKKHVWKRVAFELMHEFVCGILFTACPTGHLAMVTLIKVAQMFIFVDDFNQGILKCLRVCSTMANKNRSVWEVSVWFTCARTCAQRLQREEHSLWNRMKNETSPGHYSYGHFPKKKLFIMYWSSYLLKFITAPSVLGRIVTHQAAKLMLFFFLFRHFSRSKHSFFGKLG